MELEYPRKLSEAIGRDLIEVFTRDDGERCVWFLGRGLRNRSVKEGFSWLHYDHNIVPLEIVLTHPDLDGEICNRVYCFSRDANVEPVDIFTLKYYYSDAETEEPIPYFVYSEDIPDGYYIRKGEPA